MFYLFHSPLLSYYLSSLSTHIQCCSVASVLHFPPLQLQQCFYFLLFYLPRGPLTDPHLHYLLCFLTLYAPPFPPLSVSLCFPVLSIDISLKFLMSVRGIIKTESCTAEKAIDLQSGVRFAQLSTRVPARHSTVVCVCFPKNLHTQAEKHATFLTNWFYMFATLLIKTQKPK